MGGGQGGRIHRREDTTRTISGGATLLGDLENMVEEGSWNVAGTIFTHILTSQVGTLFALTYDYITTLFLATRYVILLLLEIVSPWPSHAFTTRI